MKRVNLFIATLVVMLMVACGEQEKAKEVATISGVIENSDITYMMLVNMDRAEQDTIFLNEDGSFQEEVDVTEHNLFTLFYKQDILEIYLKPGQDLEVVSDGKAFMADPLFKGSAAEAAQVMNDKLTMTTAVSPQELIQMTPDKFMETMNGVEKKVNEMVDVSSLSSDLKELLKSDAFFTLLPLRDGYGKRKMEEIVAIDSAAFFAYKPRIEEELKKSSNLNSTAFKMYMINYLQDEMMEKYQGEMREAGERWIIVMMEKVPAIIENTEIRDVCYQMLYRNMMMGRMVQMPVTLVPEVVETYKRLVSNEKYEKDIDTEYQAWQEFQKEAEKAKTGETK